MTRVVQQLLLLGGLAGVVRVCPADGMTVAPGAHGPVMMLYLRLPIGSPGAARVYGLRVDQQGGTRPQAGAMTDPVTSGAMPGQRSIVDLQFRHASDVRVEFGRHVTWNVARREFGLSNSQPSMALRLPASEAPTPTVARSLPNASLALGIRQ
jgi:hypothetical protein